MDHAKILANAVRWATDGQPPVRVEDQGPVRVAGQGPVCVTGPGVLDVTVWRQRHAMTVHLVNLTNPMMMRGPFRELMPVGAQTVTVRLPDGATPRRVHLLKAGGDADYSVREANLMVTVPEVVDHEVVAIDFDRPIP